jgi:hypothetical protein
MRISRTKALVLSIGLGWLVTFSQAATIQVNADAVALPSSTDLLQTQLSNATQPAGWVLVSGSNATRSPVGPLLTNGVAAYRNATLGTPAYAIAYGNEFTTGNAGNQVTFTLNTTVNTFGYDLTQIDIYHGWSDNGRDAISLTIAVATVAAPLTFTDLYTTTSYNPPSFYGRQRVIDDLSAPLATGIGAVRFTVFSAENSGAGLSEIDVFGAASVPEPAGMGLLVSAAVFLALRRRRSIGS